MKFYSLVMKVMVRNLLGWAGMLGIVFFAIYVSSLFIFIFGDAEHPGLILGVSKLWLLTPVLIFFYDEHGPRISVWNQRLAVIFYNDRISQGRIEDLTGDGTVASVDGDKEWIVIHRE